MRINQVLIWHILLYIQENALTKIQHCRIETNEEIKACSKKPSQRKDNDVEMQKESKVQCYLIHLRAWTKCNFILFILTGKKSIVQGGIQGPVLDWCFPGCMQESSHCIIWCIEEDSHYCTWPPPWLWVILLWPV